MSRSRAFGARHMLVLLAGALVVFLASADDCWGTNTAGNANTYCDHGNRIYDDQSGHGLAIAAHDPTCPQPAAAAQ